MSLPHRTKTAVRLDVTFDIELASRLVYRCTADACKRAGCIIHSTTEERTVVSICSLVFTGNITLYCKGADTVIYEHLATSSGDKSEEMRARTSEHLDVS